MAKKKAKKNEPSLDINGLVELAESTDFDPEILGGEIRDAADTEADLIYEATKRGALHDQLQFLYLHGYGFGRLKEIIEKESADPFADS